MFKRITSIILSIALMVSVCPMCTWAEESTSSDMDGSLNMFDIERTSYGVLDTDVVATKFNEGDNYDIVYPTDSSLNNYESYATPCVIIREAYDGELYKYYLVSTKRIVKTYISDEVPVIELWSDRADSCADYSIYRVYNPETKLYDVYNAITDTYYEYGLDSIFEVGGNFSNIFEYWEDCYEVCKDGKYGLLNQKGEMIYEPYYYDIRYYANCALGYVETSDSYNHTDYVLLANDGSTDGKKAYDSFVSDTDDEIYASKIIDYGPYALVDKNNLKVYTDYIYNDVKVKEINGVKYLLCSARYECDKTYSGYAYYQEIIGPDGVWNSMTETGGYNTSVEWEDGYDSFKVISYEGDIEKNYIYTINGTCLYSGVALTENYNRNPEFDNVIGHINLNKVEYEYASSNSTTKYYSIYNSSNQLIAEKLSKPVRYGNYISAKRCDTDKWIIYNYLTGEYVIDEKAQLLNNRSQGNVSIEYITGALLIANVEDKRGIFNIETGDFSGFIFTADELKDMSLNFYTNGTEKIWIFNNSSGENVYVNDEFKIISGNDLEVAGDYLIENVEYISYSTGNRVRILDYDGNVKNEFICKKDGIESKTSIDSETYKKGLVLNDGKTVLDPLYHYVGNTVNGLTLVADSSAYFSIIDNNGNALIYAPFSGGYQSSDPTYRVDYSGFVAVVRDNRYEDAVYIYDFSKCLGTASEVELPSEDILFGEYNSYLNNNFYNTLADNAASAIIDAVAAKSSHPARVTAWAKSMLSEGLEYPVKQLFSWLPTSSLSEEKMSQELAVEYLKTLETAQIESFVEETKKEYDFAKKINEYYEQIKNLDSEVNKIKFSNLWVSDKFSQDEVYQLVTEAEKKVNLLKVAGKGVTVAEYVMSYMMIKTIENEVIERLMLLVPSNSSLYKGLNYISIQQRSNYVAVFVAEYLTEEMVGKIAEFTQESLISAFTSTNASLVAFIINTAFKLISTQIDSPTLEDIDKAVIALANIQTLKSSVEEYRELIKRNCEKTHLFTEEQLKFDYSALVQTYFKSIIVGLDYAKKIAGDDKADFYDNLKAKYECKLLYRSYIDTCRVNATAMWEYTVEANKAVLSKLNAQFPKGAGRLPLYDLVFSDKYNDDDIYANVSETYEYAIDIPTSVDGYEVSSVTGSLVTNESKLNGVYVPDGIEGIGGDTFDSCTGLNTVFVGNDTEISDNAFSEDVVSSREKEVVEIRIVTGANVTEMNMQDDIDDTGLTLEVTYVDGTTEVISEGFCCDITDRVNGENTVVVNYKGVTTEYPVTIKESDCTYIVKYVDQYGNVIKDTVTGTAKSGSVFNLTAADIKGYTAEITEISETIGFENEFIITYVKDEAVSVSEAVIQVENQEFTGSVITPSVKVSVDGKELKEGTDYTVKYENNIMSGTAYVIIYGCGEYEGATYMSFEITGGVTYGDVDGSRTINASDALLVLQAAAKIKNLDEQQKLCANVNGDASVNANDALLILKHAAKIINKFPVEE